MRTRHLIVGAVAAALAATALITLTGGSDDTGDERDAGLEFEAVRLMDLEEVESLDGVLGFPEGDPIGSRLQGTITDVVGAGTIVTEGEVLYEVDGEPVVLLIGASPAFRDLGEAPLTTTVVAGRSGVITALPADASQIPPDAELFRIDDLPVIALPGDLPAWRNLRYGSVGTDVAQLEAALVGLGYDLTESVVVDGYYSSATADAVGRWQDRHGLVVDERFSLGDGVFLPDTAIVVGVRTTVGAAVGPTTPVLDVQIGSAPIEGPDVLQLQQALVRLGHPAPTTGVLDEATTAAIAAWQTAIGATPDGVVGLGEVVFLAAPVRVTEASLGIGKPVNNGSNVLTTSAASSVVLVDLDAGDQDLLVVGQVVQVELPGGALVDATVDDVDRIARRTANGDVVFEVRILLSDPAAGLDLDQAPVDVLVVTDRRTDVLAVPVTALLALAEGGYAVEVDAGDGSTRLVGVEPGLYADGWVEVTTTGLVAGDMVVVP